MPIRPTEAVALGSRFMWDAHFCLTICLHCFSLYFLDEDDDEAEKEEMLIVGMEETN